MKVKHSSTIKDLKHLIAQNEICSLELSDSWHEPYKYVESLIERFFQIIEPRVNLVKLELSDLKQIGDIGDAPVFLYKKDGVNLIQSASKDEIYSLIYSLTN